MIGISVINFKNFLSHLWIRFLILIGKREPPISEILLKKIRKELLYIHEVLKTEYNEPIKYLGDIYPFDLTLLKTFSYKLGVLRGWAEIVSEKKDIERKNLYLGGSYEPRDSTYFKRGTEHWDDNSYKSEERPEDKNQREKLQN